MNVKTMKTKEASELLGVSQTTVKRWASHFPSSFPKDRLGHYVFSDSEISLLLYMKEQVEKGSPLEQIVLPEPVVAEPILKPKIGSFSPDENEVLSRIREVERSLTQKADEVVSAQVLQHRSELDELRLMVAQLAATVENLQGNGVKSTLPQDEFRFPAMGEISAPAKKRGFFRTFF